jgi:ElaB/YqjD/DUF883 family membrane-anchored ribosome-binding protein
MSRISDTAEGYGEDARAEIAALRAKVEALVQDRVTPALDALVHEAEGAAQCASNSMKAQATRLTDGVKEQPMLSIALAAAAGFALAALVRR